MGHGIGVILSVYISIKEVAFWRDGFYPAYQSNWKSFKMLWLAGKKSGSPKYNHLKNWK